MTEPLILATSVAVLSVGMLLAWAVVMRTGNGGWTDVVWTFAVGISAVWAALAQDAAGWRPKLAAALMAAWSLRLGLHLLRRVAGSEEDFRYARLRTDWGASYPAKLLAFLQFQAVCAVPLVAAVAVAAARPGPAPDVADLLAVAIMVAAIVGEGIADRQLAAFAASNANRGKVLDQGLWAWSRHPNFFFEWLGWLAWPVMAIGPGLSLWPGAIALIAPLIMYALLVHVTGIPPIEERMLKTRGAAYRDYQRRVPALIPRPPSRQGRSP